MAKTTKTTKVNGKANGKVETAGFVSGLGETPEQLKVLSAEKGAALAAAFGKKTLTPEQVEAAYQLGLVERRRRKLDRKIRKGAAVVDEAE
jgi:hypothetical protein